MSSKESGTAPAGQVRGLWSLLYRAIAGGERSYTTGPVGRAVILLAIPMMLEMSMESLFAVVDIFFVARLGAEAVAVVGLTEAVVTILFAVAIGFSMGVTALVARRIGEGRKDDAGIVAGQAIWIGLAVSLVIGLFGIIFGADVLRLMGAGPGVIEGVAYTRILLGGSGTIMFLFLFNAVFRGAGDAALAMRTLWLANGINILLDPCLIFGLGPFPEMGVAGAAIASNIGRGTGVLYALYYMCNGRGVLRLTLSHLVLRLDIVARLLKVSFGGVLQFLIATSSWVLLMRIIAPYGPAAIAGYTIGIRMLAFTFLPAWGLGNAAATLVGQNLGAGQADRAEKSVWCACGYNMLFLGIVAVIMIAVPEPLVRIFTDEPEVVAYGTDCLRIIAYGYVFYAVGMVVVQAFNGAGDTYTPTWINLFCFWLVQVPLAWVLADSFGMGPHGVFWSVTIGESLIAFIAVAIFLRGRWKSMLV